MSSLLAQVLDMHRESYTTVAGEYSNADRSYPEFDGCSCREGDKVSESDWPQHVSDAYREILTGNSQLPDNRNFLLAYAQETDYETELQALAGGDDDKLIILALLARHTGFNPWYSFPDHTDAQSIRDLGKSYRSMRDYAHEYADQIEDDHRRELREQSQQAADDAARKAEEMRLVSQLHIGQKVTFHTQYSYEAEVIKLYRQKVSISYVLRDGRVKTRRVSPLDLEV